MGGRSWWKEVAALMPARHEAPQGEEAGEAGQAGEEKRQEENGCPSSLAWQESGPHTEVEGGGDHRQRQTVGGAGRGRRERRRRHGGARGRC